MINFLYFDLYRNIVDFSGWIILCYDRRVSIVVHFSSRLGRRIKKIIVEIEIIFSWSFSQYHVINPSRPPRSKHFFFAAQDFALGKIQAS